MPGHSDLHTHSDWPLQIRRYDSNFARKLAYLGSMMLFAPSRVLGQTPPLPESMSQREAEFLRILAVFYLIGSLFNSENNKEGK